MNLARQPALRAALAAVCACLLLAGCGGPANRAVTGASGAPRGSKGPDAAVPVAQSEAAARSAWPQLAQQLDDLILRSGSALRQPQPPSDPASSVQDLQLSQADDFSLTASFSYRNSGDYNQDGRVAISDLSAVGAYLGAASDQAGWAAAQVADGNADGQVSAQDLATIGAFLGSQVDGYMLQRRPQGEPPGDWTNIGEILPSAAIVPAGGGFLLFSHTFSHSGGRFEFRVVPFFNGPAGRISGIPGSGVSFEVASPDPALPAPQGIKASQGSYGDRVQLSWDAVPGAKRHLVFRDGGPPIAILGPVSAYVDFAVPDYLAHEYFVRAENGESISPPSASATGFLGERPGWAMYGGNARHSGQSLEVGPLNGSLSWTFDIHDFAGRSAPVVGPDGSIYIGGLGGQVYSAWPTGFLRWTSILDTEAQGVEVQATPALSPDGAVLIGASNGILYALEQSSGQERWRRGFSQPILCAVTIGPLGRIYLQNDQNLFCLGPDGSEIWRVRISHSGLNWRCSPALGHDGTVYVNGLNVEPGSLEGYTHAVSADGELLWSFPSGAAGIDGASPAVGPDGTIYTPGLDRLHAIHPDGTPAWEYYLGAAPSCPAVGSDGTVVVNGSSLFVLNADGSLRWARSNLSSPNFGSPLLDRDGNIYLPGGNLFSLTAYSLSGQLLWQAPPAGSNVSQPALSLDGSLLLASADGRLRRFIQP